ncbi:sensor histidine kinase [Lysobacter korlensis]|uniref:histidine kinase n=1 Tax=Lysobacter korlensis TaxID=553636 RepID=A0ABV6RMJ1_9GAMM
MIEQLSERLGDPAIAIAAGALVLLALVLLVLWLLALRGRRREAAKRVALERERIDLQLSLAEQTGRLRIIRELHEVAVHSMSVMIGQADGIRFAAQSDPEVAVRGATVLADTARVTIADLRRVMRVVREGEASARTQPRLKSLRELFTVMRDAGLVVVFEETGDRFDLVPGAELAIYRILQEALANSLRHGGEGTEAKVSLTWTTDGLQVRVDDDGERTRVRRSGLDPNEASQQRGYSIDDDLHALTDVVSGRGMTEMRQRAELFGGVFQANALPGVGFSVGAVFPALKYHNGVHGVNLERA